jgi:3-hydroxyacyl-CoA dehydrogenase
VLGLHFFSPAHVMKLVEVVRAEGTSEEALATAMAFSRRIRKVPVPVGMVPGFVGNRMLFHYGREAESLLEEGASPAQVDRVLQDYGMAMGVFAVRDLSGNDVGLAVRREWRARYPDFPYPEVIDAIVEAGRTGQKAGAGYYDYRDGDRTPHPSDTVQEIIAAVAKRRGVERREVSDGEILDRCTLALVNEGARLIGSGAVRSAGDVDVIYRYGYGFPAWRGGPMYDADQRGLIEVLERIRGFHERLGAWWEPAPLLVELATSGRRFTE